jgi:hypothetical protein
MSGPPRYDRSVSGPVLVVSIPPPVRSVLYVSKALCRSSAVTALLIFADDDGRLRVMTEAERSGLDPLHPLLEGVIEDLRPKPPDFTRKTYN